MTKVIQATRTGQCGSILSKTSQASSIVELATPVAHVSAFCQAVISRTIPDEFFGSDDVLRHNRKLLLRKVDQFIRLRRFEGLSLHEVMQGMKVSPGHGYSKVDSTDQAVDHRNKMARAVEAHGFQNISNRHPQTR